MVHTGDTLTASINAFSVTISDQINAVSNEIGRATTQSNWRLTGYRIAVTNQILELTDAYHANRTNSTAIWIQIASNSRSNQDEIEFVNAAKIPELRDSNSETLTLSRTGMVAHDLATLGSFECRIYGSAASIANRTLTICVISDHLPTASGSRAITQTLSMSC